ncbi:MSC_0882 family membrane protein [Mesomycoplasma molare]|uniref:Uncharacterized protein n=1 Tax=Mesomycoplasma molare TaxID=171288 RepID=A0ABY5TUA6_9BACT|nr:hypothetical protein [Mesomycoplasma molare]UWD34243.1 hypothetical protein NX772_00205 [Mesomycoplasma molare]
MKWKPLNNTDTVNFANIKKEQINLQDINSAKVYKDPEQIIPTGVYKIFARESKILKIFLIFYLFIFLVSASLIALIYTNTLKTIGFVKTDFEWSWLIIPILIASYSIFKFIIKFLDFSSMKKSEKLYRNELTINPQALPTSIANLYKRLTKQQIHHNWFLIFTFFYIGLFALAVWYFSDKVYLNGLLNFEKWIQLMTPNPEFLSIILGLSLLGNLVIWTLLTISRKKRLNDIQDYFGYQIVKDTEIDAIKIKMNKGYLKLFVLTILVLLVIPIIVLLLVKKFILKRK